MKRSVLLFTLLLTGSAAHAQYGELINLGADVLKNRALNKAKTKQAPAPGQQPSFQFGQSTGGYSQNESDFVTTAKYDKYERRNFQKKRSPPTSGPRQKEN
jgi:hypothetical protein